VNKLFISLYLDEDVSVLIGTLLRSRGFTAVSTQEAGQSGKTDAEQLSYAAAHEMAILTHNRGDFESLAMQYYNDGRHHSGIIIAVRRLPYDLARRVIELMDDITADEMVDQVRYI
jgi:hypothetical protein